MKFYNKSISILTVGIIFIVIFSSFISDDSPIKVDNDKSTPESDFFGNQKISDGPYVFLNKSSILVKWIYKDQLKQRVILRDNYKVFKKKFGFEFKKEWIQKLDEEPNYIQQYKNVEKFIAISDVHGQYELMVKLLKSHKVIDNDYNWIYGNGHLIVLGDLMDRGPKVTESLWFIYRLEQQALEQGGKVHVILGNHELMVLNNDSRYIHEKYVKTAQLMNKTYNDLFSTNTFLGKWLSKKPLMVTINDILFVHAGVSTDYITKGMTRARTNKLFAEEIIGKDWGTILNDSTLTFLMSNQGPIWYRGYFTKPFVKEYQIDHLLRYFEIEHIIVGHTSFPNIVSLYNGKIYGIDSNIKEGNYGELMIYQDNHFYRGTNNGSIISIY